MSSRLRRTSLSSSNETRSGRTRSVEAGAGLLIVVVAIARLGLATCACHALACLAALGGNQALRSAANIACSIASPYWQRTGGTELTHRKIWPSTVLIEANRG